MYNFHTQYIYIYIYIYICIYKIIKQKEGTNADTIIKSLTGNSLSKELAMIHKTQTSMLKNITKVGANAEQTIDSSIPNWRNILTKCIIEYCKYLTNV